MKHFIFLLSILIFIFSEGYGMDLIALKDSIEQIIKANKGSFAVVFSEINNSENTILINEKEMFHPASTMKTPVMAEVFNQNLQGKFFLNDSIIIKNEFKSIVDGSIYNLDISSDSGELLYKKIGSKATIEELIYEMITVSSNLATNILIDLVDAKNVTSLMKSIGINEMLVLRGVEDTKAYDLKLNNTTNAFDMFLLYNAIYKNKLIDNKSCEKMINVLKAQKFNSIIPAFLPKDIEIAHKTGTISNVVNDCGIVYPKNGRDYILIYLSKNIENNKIGAEIGAKISKVIYDFITE